MRLVSNSVLLSGQERPQTGSLASSPSLTQANFTCRVPEAFSDLGDQAGDLAMIWHIC